MPERTSWTGRGPHVVEVDDHRDRHGHAVGALAVRVLERGDRRADAVVGQVGRHGDHREAGARRGVLGDVDGPAAADADDRVVAACPQRRLELAGGAQGGVLDLGTRRRRARVGSIRRQIVLALARRPTATSTLPVVEMYRSCSRAERSSTAPRRMSTNSGLASIRVSSGTRSPGPGAGRRGRRPRPRTSRSGRPCDLLAAVDQLLVAVLVVEVRVALEGGLQRVGEPSASPTPRSGVAPMYSPYARRPGPSAW